MSTVREAHARLAASQKPGAGVPWYMRTVNRRLGRWLAAAASVTRLTPDALTALSALSAVVALALLVALPPTLGQAVAVVVLLQLAFALDSADGQLARLRGGGSLLGEWTDHVVDAARTLLFHLSIAVAWVVHGDGQVGGDGWALVALAFAVVVSVRFFAQILAEQLQKGQPQKAGPPGPSTAEADSGSRGSWIQTPSDTGVLNAVLILWAWPAVFWPVYAVLALANALLMLATLARKRRALGVPVGGRSA